MKKEKKKTMLTVIITIILTLLIVFIALVWFVLSVFNKAGNAVESITTGSNNYRIEKDSVFYKDKHIEGADPATFTQIGRYYTKDANHVFYSNSYLDPNMYFLGRTFEILTLQNADPNTFEVVSEKYGKDHKLVFFKGIEILEADPSSFKEFDNKFHIDNKYVYSGKSVLEGADPNYFISIGNSYYRDQNHVWCLTNELSVPHPNKVTSINYNFIKNDLAVYFMDNNYQIHPIDVNPDNFRLLHSDFHYVTDGKKIYYEYKLIPTADYSSFRSFMHDTIVADEFPDASDNRCFYKKGEIIGSNN